MPNSFDGFRRTAQHAFFSALDDHVDRLTWDRQRIVDTQQRCRTLLAHAAANSPFHARRIAAAGIDPAELEPTYSAFRSTGADGWTGMI
jgi:hypothetical protein